jgi:N-acetylglutamate synthase-like GNAT family acetyltransferase
MVELRDVSDADVDEVARIYTDSWNTGFGDLIGYRTNTPERLARWRRDLHDSTVKWTVADIDGVVAGYSVVGPSRDPLDPAVGELQTIAVNPSYWRRGVGRTLMQHSLDELLMQYDSAILWTVTGYERGAAFYRAMGWTPLGWLRAEGTETAFGHRLNAAN